jgi:hypothetical protein
VLRENLIVSRAQKTISHDDPRRSHSGGASRNRSANCRKVKSHQNHMGWLQSHSRHCRCVTPLHLSRTALLFRMDSVSTEEPLPIEEEPPQAPKPQHAPDSTPPVTEASMEPKPIISITQRLLGLRGSPPGTLASLGEPEIKLLCERVRPIRLQQAMLLELEAPLKICGDIHGQFTDLLWTTRVRRFPSRIQLSFSRRLCLSRKAVVGNHLFVVGKQNSVSRKNFHSP